MLAAIDRERLAGDAAGLRQMQDGCGDFLRGNGVSQGTPATSRRKPSSPSASLGSTGPGATALTRMRGASACAIVRVAAWRAALLSV